MFLPGDSGETGYEDSRTVTVISDPGTENEKTVSETGGKGCAVSFYVEGITLYKDGRLYRSIRRRG